MVSFKDGVEVQELEFNELLALSKDPIYEVSVDEEEPEDEEDTLLNIPQQNNVVPSKDKNLMYVSKLDFTDPVEEAGICTWFNMRHRRDSDIIMAMFSMNPEIDDGIHFLTLQGKRLATFF